MKSLLLVLMIAGVAAAQPVEYPDAPALAIEVTATNGELDAAQVRDAIGRELDVAVVAMGSAASTPLLGTLHVNASGGAVRVAYEPPNRTPVERSLLLPRLPDERVQLVTYIASNMIRDQAAELLAQLSSASAPPPPPSAPVALTPPSAPVALAPPGSTVAAPTTAGSQPPPTALPPPSPLPPSSLPSSPLPPSPLPPSPLPPQLLPPPHNEFPVAIGLLWPISLERLAGPHVAVDLGVHALAGAHDGSHVLSVSGLVDVERYFADGAQVAGLATFAHAVHGVQFAGVSSIGSRVEGIQAAGVASIGTDVHGVQFAGVASIGRAVLGMQVGGVASISRAVLGMQVGGVAAIGTHVDGIQIGGVATVGDDVHGMQVGLVNVAGQLHGLQIGLINVSDGNDDAYPIGLINIARHGGVAIDAWAETDGLLGLALRHGPRHLHNVWAVAWTPDYGHALVGAGLGTTARITGRFSLDIDGIHWWTDVWSGKWNMISQLRAALAVRLGPIDLLAGAAENIYVGDSKGIQDTPFLDHRYTSPTSTTQVVGWPTLFAGIRVHAH